MAKMRITGELVAELLESRLFPNGEARLTAVLDLSPSNDLTVEVEGERVPDAVEVKALYRVVSSSDGQGKPVFERFERVG